MGGNQNIKKDLHLEKGRRRRKVNRKEDEEEDVKEVKGRGEGGE